MTYKETEIKELKMDVFHKYVEKSVIEYPVADRGKSVSTYLNIKETNLGVHFNELYHKYKFKKSYEELHTEYTFWIFQAIQDYTPEGVDMVEGLTAILRGTDELLENQLLKYIRLKATHGLWKFVNPEAFRTTTMVDGKTLHYTIVMEMEGLDNLLSGEYEDTPPLQLTDENAVFDSTIYQYYVTYFSKWFQENKEDILADTQLKFLDDLRKVSKDHMLTKEEFEEVTGVKWENYSKRMRTIENTIEREWNNHQPTKKTRRQVSLEPRIKYLEGYMKLVKEADPMTQNLQLTDYLVKGMQDKKVEYEVFKVTNEVLNLDELILFNQITNNKNEKRVSLRTTSLIKLTNGIKEMLESLLEDYEREVNIPSGRKDINKTKVPFKNKKKRKSEVKVFNKDGRLIGKHIKLIRDMESYSHIFHLTPNGALTNRG